MKNKNAILSSRSESLDDALENMRDTGGIANVYEKHRGDKGVRCARHIVTLKTQRPLSANQVREAAKRFRSKPTTWEDKYRRVLSETVVVWQEVTTRIETKRIYREKNKKAMRKEIRATRKAQPRKS